MRRLFRNAFVTAGSTYLEYASKGSSRMVTDEQLFKAQIVQSILNKEPDEALEALSQHYSVDTPRLKVGMPKKSGGKAACYVSKTKTIHVSSQEQLENPFVILHEFYHHFRTQGQKHRGTEKLANRFAEEYISTFQGTHKQSFRVSYPQGQ